MTRSILLNRALRRLRTVYKGTHNGNPRGSEGRRVDGLPHGVSLEEVNDLCMANFQTPLKDASFSKLSSWKEDGAFRLYLRMADNSRHNLVYKQVVYHKDQIPALDQLPVCPGPPEFVVYNNPHRSLRKYLPQIYSCSVDDSEQRYRYFMQDLGDQYRLANTPVGLLTVAAELANIHQEMAQWSRIPKDALPHYDQQFSSALQGYTEGHLLRYVCHRKDKKVAKVLDHWAQIIQAHDGLAATHGYSADFIHGDLGASNCLIHTQFQSRIKLIDWEWAGLGMPHSDLVSLIKFAPPEIEKYALAIYSRQDNGMSIDDHRYLYNWCKLERGLLDAGFVAAQYMHASTETRLDLPGFIHGAMQRVLDAWVAIRT